MKYRLLSGAALIFATVLGGCTVDPAYNRYSYAPGYYPPANATYGYPSSNYYEPVAGSYTYRYRPFYSSDYSGYYDINRINGGGNG
jgi:hypothetical protein